MRFHLDYETYSECDIKLGHIPYAMHPSTKVLMAAYCLGNGEVIHWDATKDPDVPYDLALALRTRNVTKWAQNASFEIAITWFVLRRQCGIEPHADLFEWIKQWRCSMVQGMAMSMSGSLKQQGEVLRSRETKLADEGKKLIHRFCKPVKVTKKNPLGYWDRHNSPDEWADFCKYNVMDVEAERSNWNKTSKFPLPEYEWDLWHYDQKINFTGLPVDMELVEAAIDVDIQVKEIFMQRYRDLTGLENPNSTAQVLPWLQERGYPYDHLQKDPITNLLSGNTNINPMSGDAVKALELRQVTSKIAIKKFYALRDAVVDGRLYGCFQFCGAGRTWRWAGRKFQPQNIARGVLKAFETKDGMDTSQFEHAIWLVKSRDLDLITVFEDVERIPDLLSSLVRPAIASPSPDKVLTVADLASIETIMIGWAANSTYMLDLFENGLDPYKDFGSKLLGIPYDEINKAQRTYCKPVVLGAGYMLGGMGLIAYAEGMGVNMTEEQAYEAISVYRNAYPDVPKFWDKLQDAAFKCVKTGAKVTVNGKFIFRMEKPCMTIELPSGRKLVYIRPMIEKRSFQYRDRETKKMVTAWSDALTYEGMIQGTRKWSRISTHAGKITENIIQAIARDVLAHGLMKCKDEPSLEVVGHVHDEILALTPEGDEYKDLLVTCMTDRPDWCLDLPLGSSVYQSPFYIKD